MAKETGVYYRGMVSEVVRSIIQEGSEDVQDAMLIVPVVR